METDEDTNNNSQAANQRVENRGRLWSREETQFLLRMYKKHEHDIGLDKLFRSNLHLWNDISKNLNKTFRTQRTTVQCIGRFKTLQRKNSSGGSNSNNNYRTKKSTAVSNEMTSSDDDMGMQESSTDTDQPLAIAEVIRSTLLEIHELKEEAKDRRHRERMQLLEKFLHQNSAKEKAATQQQMELVENKIETPRPTVLGVQQPTENDNQAMRARLLEMQRKKMEDRERKQRVSIATKQQRPSVRDLK